MHILIEMTLKRFQVALDVVFLPNKLNWGFLDLHYEAKVCFFFFEAKR